MSEQILIEIPDYIAEHMHEIAQLTGQTVNQVLAERLAMDSLLPSHEIDVQLKQLQNFSDGQLWWLLALGFPMAKKARLRYLTEQSKEETLSDVELSEHEQLMEEYAWYDLIRSQAIILLQDRDYDVRAYLKAHRPSR
jgi:hypothetical protein